ncbi:hypothetical protein BCR44DRAFT_1170367 [Catenaria anguillulae PL171]|uniref:Uncharacterized protein n=1 Tax=Catenaria anguillulae PL171 TaxID=765915 RepID=A0A1Y2I2L7_9FUNG|nr:hypothetical protein BCR44DRAFT_1170367 [Catenaria anguillulae PL171]
MKYSKSATSDPTSTTGRPRSAISSSDTSQNPMQQHYVQRKLAHYRSALESCLGKHDYATIWQPPESILMDTNVLLVTDGYRTVCEGTLRPATPVHVYCYDAVTAANPTMRASASAGSARHNRRKSSRSRQASTSPVGSKPTRPSPLALSMSMGDMDADESQSEVEVGPMSSSIGAGGITWSDRQVVEMWIEEVKMLRYGSNCASSLVSGLVHSYIFPSCQPRQRLSIHTPATRHLAPTFPLQWRAHLPPVSHSTYQTID